MKDVKILPDPDWSIDVRDETLESDDEFERAARKAWDDETIELSSEDLKHIDDDARARVLDLVSNHDRAEKVFEVEQAVREVHRWTIPTCIEHGFRLSRCRELGLYHANGKVRHGCVKGFP